jgi:hypothetical protein
MGEETATWGGKELGGEVGEEYRLVSQLERERRGDRMREKVRPACVWR